MSLLQRLHSRTKPAHGGGAHPGVKDWWYLSEDDSAMHAACAAEICALRALLAECLALGFRIDAKLKEIP